MMCSTDEQQWQESEWNGACVLQEAPHLRDLVPTLDRAWHDSLREMQPGALEVSEIAPAFGTTSAMLKQASAFGATSARRHAPTNAARRAKIAVLTRSDSPSDANAQSAVLKRELRRGNTPLLLKLCCAVGNRLIEKLLHLSGSLLRKVALLTAQFTLLLA